MTAPADALTWAADGGDAFHRALGTLGDDAFARPCTLPGWTLGHLVAHVAYNAEALRRLAHWARTGERTPMYASADARNAEIEQGAALPPRELRALSRDADAALRADLAALPDEAWSAEVVTAQGRTVPASEVPWMRTREAWIHAVDLAAGVGFADIPAPAADRLVSEITDRRTEPPMVLAAADRDRLWIVDGPDPARVIGRTTGLARWLTGRGADDVTVSDGALPDLGKWL
ncbi:MAG TPA: maleylpyruvate isomerase family mycothiol-dependent enzyme [Streptosporangiaceae bacterium]|jgi:maleylpyruvate isomerase